MIMGLCAVTVAQTPQQRRKYVVRWRRRICCDSPHTKGEYIAERIAKLADLSDAGLKRNLTVSIELQLSEDAEDRITSETDMACVKANH